MAVGEWQVWDPEQCAELVCAFLKPALLKAHAEGRADMLEGAAPVRQGYVGFRK